MVVLVFLEYAFEKFKKESLCLEVGGLEGSKLERHHDQNISWAAPMVSIVHS
jgi:hypothetical protein